MAEDQAAVLTVKLKELNFLGLQDVAIDASRLSVGRVTIGGRVRWTPPDGRDNPIEPLAGAVSPACQMATSASIDASPSRIPRQVTFAGLLEGL